MVAGGVGQIFFSRLFRLGAYCGLYLVVKQRRETRRQEQDMMSLVSVMLDVCQLGAVKSRGSTNTCCGKAVGV